MLARDVLVTAADIVTMFDGFAGGGAVDFDEHVFASERTTGHRNRAIAHLLRQFGVIEVDAEVALDRYLEACSTRTTVGGLAHLSAMLARGGRRPGSDERVVPRWVTGDTLSVMSTCGMYDAAGHFVFDVGLPAKSGVSGALMAVVPDRFGVAIFSPRVDPHGTSVRGLSALCLLAERLSLHPFEANESPRPALPYELAVSTSVAIVERTLTRIVRARRPYGRRRPAQYAARLAQADVASTAIAVCTTAGATYAAGESDLPFSIQAAANPFAYATALERFGPERVHARVGVEPSGNPSDAIRFDTNPVRPFNPLENAGAIAIAGLLAGDTAHSGGAEADLGAFVGAPLSVDERMLAEEILAGERNRAIAALLRSAGIVDDEEAALHRYFRQCSVTVTTSTLARLAAVLASYGVDPVTGARVISARTARDVLSVMYTAGMHDASGEFAVSVGIPAKSGISGCIVAVAPGRMGVAVYSPGIDARGFSVRGAAMLRDLSRILDLRVSSPRRPGKE